MKINPVSDMEITPLLANAFFQSQTPDFRSPTKSNTYRELAAWGYFSVFDIVKVGPERFKRRHQRDFHGGAETLYRNALSYATQLIHQARERGLREGELLWRSRSINEGNELPSYADLFPEPWDNFCKPGELEALNSPIAYLLELYQFARQLELDASEGAVLFSTRRPDIPELLLDKNNSSEDLPALQIVNEILSFIAADYIDRSEQTGKSVDEVLGETHYPWHLPFSLPTLQISLGLNEKKTTLANIIQTLQRLTPDFCTKMQPSAANSLLLAATQLGEGQMTLLIEDTPFPAVSLTQPELALGYQSGSTTETLTDKDLSAHGYIVPESPDAQGPKTLTNTPMPTLHEPYDTIKVFCQNEAGEKATVLLRGQSILSYYRVKSPLKPFSDSAPYPRRLLLSWHAEDNPSLNLARGPWFGHLTIQAQAWENEPIFLTLKYHLALFDKPLPAEQLYPEAAAFFEKNYGITAEEVAQLPEILFFIDRTKGTVDQVEQAIAWGDFSPVASDNITFTNPIFTNGQSESRFPLPFQVGASYLNGGLPESIGINFTRPRSMTSTNNQRFDRFHRLLRLQRWLAIPCNELDWLLMSAMRAEGERNLALEINVNTLRAIGLYRHLNERYGITTDAFSALLHTLSPFAISGQPTFLDQVFNQPKLFNEPFFISNQPFKYNATRGDDGRLIKQLCAGLKITTATFQTLAERVNQAFKLKPEQLVCSLPVISALYRLTTLARIFKITPEQGVMLLDALSMTGGYDATILAGEPTLSPLTADGKGTTEVDVLDVILSLEALTEWLRQSQIKPEALCLMLQSIKLPAVATDSTVAFFDGLRQGLPNTLLKETDFQAGDIPALPSSENWLTKLNMLIEPSGLVKVLPLGWRETEEDYLAGVLTPIVQELIPDDEQKIAIAVAALTQVIIQGKAAQEDLVSASVAKEYGVGRDIVPALLRWIGSSVADFLTKINQPESQPIRSAREVSEQLLTLIYNLAMNASLIKQLRLKVAIIELRLLKPEWLGLSAVTGGILSLQEIWVFSRFRQWAMNSQFSEDELIDYFSFANTPTEAGYRALTLDRDCAELLADILEWDADEIELATQQFTLPRARTMEQVDWLRRLMALSLRLSLPVEPLLTMSTLTPFPPYAQIASIGESVMTATQIPAEE